MTQEDTSTPHALPAERCLALFGSRFEGLSATDACRRLREAGPNQLPRAKRPGVIKIFLRQFLNPLIYILLIAGVASILLGDAQDALFIFGVLVLNGGIGTVQERSAERSADALRELVKARSTVIRDGEEQDVDAEDLVVGDVVVIESGTKVPADLRLLSGDELQIDESLLTGESLPVDKVAEHVLSQDAVLGDRINMAFAGTWVARGRARGLVVATGLATAVGAIAASMQTAVAARPPLLQRMDQFTRRIAIAIGAVVLLLSGVSLVQGASLQSVFFLAVALAVAAIPEGLPVALTVALSIAVRRMSRRHVIVRRLAAVETLGSCTFIASDKTGTLTVNELTVRQVALPGEATWRVTGQGLGPEGGVLAPEDADAGVPASARLLRLAKAVASCNDGTLVQQEQGNWTSHGDAVDVALLVFAHKLGVTRASCEAEAPRVAALPFEAARQCAATMHDAGGKRVLMVKGAGEKVLAMCDRMATSAGDVPIDRAALQAEAERIATSGHRVLAVATLVQPASGAQGAGLPALVPEMLHGLSFLGFVGQIDPLRPEAAAAVSACRRAGIEVAMVTGDHALTAKAIAVELGIVASDAPVVTGPALREAAARGAEAFAALIRGARVFARVEPRQKLEIVRALIAQGHFVAVTGDGANDAPALKSAHIGVAMGKRGTDVAREAAALVLTDDNFASIVAGVEEGRIAYANVRKVVFLLLSTATANLVLFCLAVAAGLPLPLLPVQLLWLNLVTNGIQDVGLAFEQSEGGELLRPPRAPQEPVIDRLMIERTVLSCLVIGGVSFGLYVWLLARGVPLAEVRNVLLLLIVLFSNIQAGNSRSETRSLLRHSPLKNPVLFVGTMVAQLVHVGAMYTPGLREVLAIAPVSFRTWLTLVGLALSLFVAMEAHKAWLTRRGAHSALAT